MKINYEQIEQDYPNAYGVFKQSKYYRVSEQGYLLFDDRDLYDFFDEQKLIITISHNIRFGYMITDHNNMLGWTIIHQNEYNKFNTRTKAEACAFNAAFKLLEETLSNWTSADNLKREFGI